MSIGKVVLIQPRRDGRFLGKAAGAPYTLMRLASLVPDEVPVEIWDENLGPLHLDRLAPQDLVGITAKTTVIDRAEAIAARARPHCGAIVVGGTHATLVPDDVARWADAVVIGEGYRTWPQIIRDFADDSLDTMYRDEEWAELGNVARLTDRVIEQVDEHRHYWTPYLEITRGCPRNCTFCTAIRVSGRIMRHRPVESVVEEIERRRLKRFFLTDDNFGLNFRTSPEYLVELFDALERLPLRGWTAQSEMIVSEFPELLDRARHAHLDKLFIGFESLNPANRGELGGKSRGVAEETLKTIRTIQDHGIGVVGLFVLGFDEDTFETFEATWDFIRSSGLDGVSLTILTPYPETPFRQQLISQDRLLDLPWEYYDTAHVTYEPARMSIEELEQAYDWICSKAYNPLRIAKRGLRMLSRHPLHRIHDKLFSSFSTDWGYRRAYSFRNVEYSQA